MKNKFKVNNHFLLFANCIPVKGVMRSIICDLQLGNFKFIPNELYEILKLTEKYSISKIKSFYSTDYDVIIDEYFEFLLEAGFGVFRNKIEKSFINLNLGWDEPKIISNCIIDQNENSSFDFVTIFQSLENLGCKDIQIRFFTKTTEKFITNILELLNNSRIKCVELIMKYDINFNDKNMLKICAKFPRVKSIILHSSVDNRFLLSQKDNNMGNIVYVKDIIISDSHCGIINKNNMRVNLAIFTESQHHNTCLNRKISIDANGEIKNCPSMQKSYGNIKNITLEEALNKQGFKDLWNIKKNDIKICQDCEFRHVCTDCRAYIDNLNDVYSHPAKCTYNPYLAKWKDEEGYVPIIEMTDEEINKTKLENQINYAL